jgi:hypothetical protein
MNNRLTAAFTVLLLTSTIGAFGAQPPPYQLFNSRPIPMGFWEAMPSIIIIQPPVTASFTTVHLARTSKTQPVGNISWELLRCWHWDQRISRLGLEHADHSTGPRRRI